MKRFRSWRRVGRKGPKLGFNPEKLKAWELFPKFVHFIFVCSLVLCVWLVWRCLALCKTGILFWIDGSFAGSSEWVEISRGLFRFEGWCLFFWIVIDLFRMDQLINLGRFRGELIAGGVRAFIYSFLTGCLGILIYLVFLIPGEPKEGRRYHSSSVASVLMAEKAQLYFAPTALQQVQGRSPVTDKGRASADSLMMGQLLYPALLLLFWYGFFVRSSYAEMRDVPLVEATIHAVYEGKARPRGGGMNNR